MKNKEIRYLIIGFILGSIIANMPLAWAAARNTWRDGTGTEKGTTANPVVVSFS